MGNTEKFLACKACAGIGTRAKKNSVEVLGKHVHFCALLGLDGAFPLVSHVYYSGDASKLAVVAAFPEELRFLDGEEYDYTLDSLKQRLSACPYGL